MLGLLSAGCANRVPFTRELIATYGLTDADLTRLQYYVSGEIKLKRTESATQQGREGDTLTRNVRVVRNIVLVDPETPGVAERVGNETLSISFEEGSRFQFRLYRNPENYLHEHSILTPTRRLTPEEERRLGNHFEGACVFEYRGKEYYAPDAAVSHVFLMVDERDLVDIQTRKRKLPGRRVE